MHLHRIQSSGGKKLVSKKDAHEMWSIDGGTQLWDVYNKLSRVGMTLVERNATGFRECSTFSYSQLRNNTKLFGESIDWLQGLSLEEMLKEVTLTKR